MSANVRKIGYDLVHIFVRFPSLNIPNGATILSANIKFYMYTISGNIYTRFYCQAIDNAPVIPDSTDTSSLTWTTNYVTFNSWSGVGLTDNLTPDLSVIIQEVINRPGWVSGNALKILWKCVEPTARYNSKTIYTSEYLSEYTPELILTYIT